MGNQKILDRIKEFPFVQKSLEVERTNFSMFGCEVGDGWSDLIYELCKKIHESGEDVIISQVKEKLAGLRFYTYGASDLVQNWIDIAEDLSYTICEQCSKPGELKNNGWLFTMCDECWKKYQEEQK